MAAGIQQHEPEHPAPVVVSSSSSAVVPPRPSTSAPSTKAPPSSAPTSRHSVAPTAAGALSARGDVNAHSTVYWEQNGLTVDVAQPLSALTVELRVAETSGVQSTGTWRTAPADDFTITVTPSDGFLVYRWTLKLGRTIPAAQQISPRQVARARPDALQPGGRVRAPARSPRTAGVRARPAGAGGSAAGSPDARRGRAGRHVRGGIRLGLGSFRQPTARAKTCIAVWLIRASPTFGSVRYSMVLPGISVTVSV